MGLDDLEREVGDLLVGAATVALLTLGAGLRSNNPPTSRLMLATRAPSQTCRCALGGSKAGISALANGASVIAGLLLSRST